MYLKQRRSSTDPRLRSLLQKAVRRGYVDVVNLTAHRLYQLGDRIWLRSRAAVITFEEAWPLAEMLLIERGEKSTIDALVNATTGTKQKDAAGLGALAYAYHEGDRSMEQTINQTWPIRVVSQALDRPQQFFEWAFSHCQDDRQRAVVLAAKKYLAAATWGWDKACILAGAFLASSSGVPSLTRYYSQPKDEFPYWIALDKHTPEGKKAFHAVADRLSLPYRQIIWAGFYCESAITDSMVKSLWWEAEKSWRLAKVGLSPETAAALWHSVCPMLREQITSQEANLRTLLQATQASQQELL